MALKSNSLHGWLQQMQLGQYEPVLHQYGYDTLEKCTFLNEKTLDKLGILLPGHKKRILANLPVSGDYCYAKSIPFNFDDDIPSFPAPEPPVGSPPPMLPPKNSRRKQEQMSEDTCVVKTATIPEKPIPRPRVTVMKKNPPDESDRPVPMPRSRLPAMSEIESVSEMTGVKGINTIHNLNVTPNSTASESSISDDMNHCQTDMTSSQHSELRRNQSDKDNEKCHQRSTSTLLVFDPYFVKSSNKIINTPSSAIASTIKDGIVSNSTKDNTKPESNKMFTFDATSNAHKQHGTENSKNVSNNTAVTQNSMYEHLWVLKSLQNQENSREAVAAQSSSTIPPLPLSSQPDVIYKQIEKTDFNSDPPSYPPPPLPSNKAPPIPPRPIDKGKSFTKSLDPFNGQDPFKDFEPVCEIFNQGSVSGLDEVEFDPFFQHGSTIPSGSTPMIQQGFYPETLNSVPPAQHAPSTGLQKPFNNSKLMISLKKLVSTKKLI